MGLLDGTLKQKILRLEKLTSPNQAGKGTKELNDSINKLRQNIRMQAKKTAKNGKKTRTA